MLLTRTKKSTASPEEQVRNTIQNFDTAVQTGDLPNSVALPAGTSATTTSIMTSTMEGGLPRVSAAKQYPVIAAIDQVVVNGDHAEANVTTFMAFDPQPARPGA